MPDLTPEEEGAVRDLLASGRHDEPVPPAVAARLDATLAGLSRERSPAAITPAPDAAHPVEEETPDSPPGDLAARRSRRTRQRLAGALVAAAAAVVAVVAISQTVPSPLSDSADSAAGGSEAGDGGVSADELEAPSSEEANGSAGGGADRGGSLNQGQDEVTAPYDAPSELRAEAPADERGRRRAVVGLPVVRDATFADDSRAARAQRAELTASEGRLALPYPDCEADTGSGRQVLVRHRGGPALLVFRQASGAVQQVDLYRCGSSEPLRTAMIAAE